MMLQARTTLGSRLGTDIAPGGVLASGLFLREATGTGCLLVTSAVGAEEVVAAASQAIGLPLPLLHGAVVRSHERMALWLSPRSWIVCCDPDDEAAIVRQIEDAFPDRLVHAAAFADFLGWLDLWGTGSGDVLREGGFVSLEPEGLPVGHAKRTVIAGVTAIVIRAADDSWLIGVERSRADYLVRWLAKCVADDADRTTRNAWSMLAGR